MKKDPLKKIIKSPSEIEEMKTRGEIIIPIMKTKKGIGRGKWKRNGYGKFIVIASNFIIKKRFETQKEAKKWALMNYFGNREAFKVCKLPK